MEEEEAKLVGAKERVEEIAADLVEHYETRTSVLEGKTKSEGDFTAETQRSQRNAKLDSLESCGSLRPFAISASLR